MISFLHIGERLVGAGAPCFLIAEIGSNHNQDLDQAYRLIDAAVAAGVDAVKFQSFRAADHYSKRTPKFGYLGGLDTYKLIESLELERSWHQPLKAYTESAGLVFLSSPCDRDAVAELAELGMCAFKVASFDLPDLQLIRQIAETGKPLILSTGMADWMDIQRALDEARKAGNEQLALLQCTSLYPAPVALSNLRAIDVMREAFSVVTGYSDHTEGDHVCIAAVARGAAIIEKHFTLDRSMPGPDHQFAIEPRELTAMVRRIRDVEAALGDGAKAGPRAEEMEMFEKGRRSLHAACSISQGEVISTSMLAIKRPGYGIPPYLVDKVIGRVALRNIEADEWITWGMI